MMFSGQEEVGEGGMLRTVRNVADFSYGVFCPKEEYVSVSAVYCQ